MCRLTSAQDQLLQVRITNIVYWNIIICWRPCDVYPCSRIPSILLGNRGHSTNWLFGSVALTRKERAVPCFQATVVLPKMWSPRSGRREMPRSNRHRVWSVNGDGGSFSLPAPSALVKKVGLDGSMEGPVVPFHQSHEGVENMIR